MQKIKSFYSRLIKPLKIFFDNSHARESFVKTELIKIPAGRNILDAGCGDQKYRKYCSHLNYYAQDFGGYKVDIKKTLGSLGLGGRLGYEYGTLDFTGDIWNIDVESSYFDAVICTEVIEHVAYPIETIKELSRILKPDGKLILTAPSNCLRHMDPFFFTSGFSDRWYEQILPEMGFTIESLVPIGNYYHWMAVEIFRTIRANRFSLILILPSLFYFAFKKSDEISQNTLCMGYHVVAIKK